MVCGKKGMINFHLIRTGTIWHPALLTHVVQALAKLKTLKSKTTRNTPLAQSTFQHLSFSGFLTPSEAAAKSTKRRKKIGLTFSLPTPNNIRIFPWFLKFLNTILARINLQLYPFEFYTMVRYVLKVNYWLIRIVILQISITILILKKT